MLLQDGTDPRAHWPTHKFYSVSLHTEKSRYLNYFTGKEMKKILSIISKDVKLEAPCGLVSIKWVHVGGIVVRRKEKQN